MPPLIKETKKEVLQPYEIPTEDEEHKDLSTILDEEIEKVKIEELENSDVVNYDFIEETLKEEVIPLENECEVKNILVDIKEKIVDLRKQDHDSSIDILRETHYIKKNMALHNKTTYTLMFISGVAFGMADAKWMPYASLLYDGVKQILGKG